MSFKRISGILLQEYYITKRSLEVIVDVVFFPLINIMVFGFLSLYLSGKGNPDNAYPLLLGMILWQLLYITQYSISVGSLWSIWARNLSNLFISPISIIEYNVAFVISGSLKALVVFLTSALLSLYLFHFNVFQLGITNLLLFFINMVLFGISTGLVIIGLIFRYGTRIQALAWGVTFLFQPLTAAFFPVSVLPVPFREIAYLFPATFVFEAARAAIHNPAINWQLMGIALIENIIYMVICTWVFKKLFAKSKETGQFARNEG
jgi:ABC-2 type transport system permease protein